MPSGLTLEGFDWTFQPRADRSKLEALATYVYVRQKENVLFLGPPGDGKSHLAISLGVKAVKNGFSVTHFVLDELMRALKSDATIPLTYECVPTSTSPIRQPTHDVHSQEEFVQAYSPTRRGR